ncbi:MAG: hypothetical protein WC846_05105 [Candidatus Gracilibacteria bacterium]
MQRLKTEIVVATPTYHFLRLNPISLFSKNQDMEDTICTYLAIIARFYYNVATNQGLQVKNGSKNFYIALSRSSMEKLKTC